MKFVQKSSNSNSVCRELRKRLRAQAAEWFRVLRIDVVVSPTSKRNSYYRLTGIKTWKQWIKVAMIHWYLPDTAFAIVHLELERIAAKFGADKAIIAQIILSSEPEMVLYFLESSAVFCTEREMFGFINQPFRLKSIHFSCIEPQKAKKKVFRRGYNDQGSRRLPHEQHEAKFDFSYTEEQNRIEEERQRYEETFQAVQGWIS